MSFFLAMAIMVLPDQIAHPTLDEIRRGLEIRDARFQRAAFRVTYHDRLLNGRGGPFLGRLQVINALVDAEGNARIDVVARETAPADSKEGIDRTYTEITGKEESRYYNLGDKNIPPNGWIKRRQGLSWCARPLDIVAIAYGSPILYLKGVIHVHVSGVDLIEGRDTVKLSWIVPQKDGDIGQRGTYWIAPSLGYAVVRIEEDSKVGPNLPWKPVKNLSLAGFHEVGGLWFPASGRLVDHNYYVKDGGYEVSKELAAEFTDWKLDIPVSDKMFLYVFPKDTLVDDYVSGNRTYRVGAIDDPRIKSQVAQAKDMITTPENDLKTRFAEAVKDDPFGVGNPHWWLYSTVGLVIVLAVSSFSILRTKNKLFKGHA